jgi:hypothetical protein
VVLEAARLLLRQDDDLPRPLGEALEHLRKAYARARRTATEAVDETARFRRASVAHT